MSASSSDMSASRALINSDEGLQATALGVYAYKELADETKTLVFDNTKLEYTDKGWGYSPTKYWDKAATEYSFVAYSPYSNTEEKISYDETEHKLTINKIPYWQTIDGNETDYLVASSSGSADYYLTQQQTSTAVNFNFSHILSQLVINIKKDEKLSQTYLLKKVEYLNVPQGDPKATYSLPLGGSGTMSKITLLNADATLTQFTDANGQAVKATSNIPLPHLVVPFTLTDKQVQVKVTYTVAGTERNKTVDTGITQLEAGKRYELTLTFKGTEIVPELEVKNWIEKPVDEDPKYNW